MHNTKIYNIINKHINIIKNNLDIIINKYIDNNLFRILNGLYENMIIVEKSDECEEYCYKPFDDFDIVKYYINEILSCCVDEDYFKIEKLLKNFKAEITNMENQDNKICIIIIRNYYYEYNDLLLVDPGLLSIRSIIVNNDELDLYKNLNNKILYYKNNRDIKNIDEERLLRRLFGLDPHSNTVQMDISCFNYIKTPNEDSYILNIGLFHPKALFYTYIQKNDIKKRVIILYESNYDVNCIISPEFDYYNLKLIKSLNNVYINSNDWDPDDKDKISTNIIEHIDNDLNKNPQFGNKIFDLNWNDYKVTFPIDLSKYENIECIIKCGWYD